MVVGLVFSLCVSSFHSSLVGERMLGDSGARNGHVLLICLNDEDVSSSCNEPMVGDWMDFQEREPSTHLSREEVEGDERGKG